MIGAVAAPAAPPTGTDPAGGWAFDRDWITVNHGSFGAVPRAVAAAAADWRARINAQPTRFFHAEWPALIRAAAAALARRIGCGADTLGFVSNATEGINAVLRARPFAPGDAIVLFDQAYGAVREAVRFNARLTGAIVRTVPIPFPAPDLAALQAALVAALADGRARLAILDHVLAPSGLALPIASLVACCRAHGVPVLVDGAHAPGQLTLDAGAIGADWYVGNLHKWWFAPPSVGFLHANGASAQEKLHPLAVSHALDGGFAAEFDWVGTRDPVPWLVAEHAALVHDALGGDALMARNAALVRKGADIVADRLGTAAAPHWIDGVGSMAVVRLPQADAPATATTALALRERLIASRLDAPVAAIGGSLWLRLSAQHYNDVADYERAAAVVARSLGRR